MTTTDKRFTHAVKGAGLWLLLCLLAASCRHRSLSEEEWPYEAGVVVEIHWDGIAEKDRPAQGMRVQLFPWDGQGSGLSLNLPVEGGPVTLPGGVAWFTLCYDYYGSETINFRNRSSLASFEAYSIPATGLYNTYGPGSKARGTADEEPTVAEPYPYNFFVAPGGEPFTAIATDTVQRLHFYPRNVTREFTFLITDVQGVRNIAGAHGAISGMASIYRMADGTTGGAPSTVLFGSERGRVQWWADGRQAGWTQAMLDGVFDGNARLDDWPAGWQDPAGGWRGDWVMGSFCTFGPVDPDNIRNRLTVEVISRGEGYYYAVWGGAWEDSVREQIAGALGEQGTREEQLAWRRRNGGFDIVLENQGRLVIPDGKPTPGDGGLNVDMDGFDNLDIPL
jgi:hypothetical protein